MNKYLEWKITKDNWKWHSYNWYFCDTIPLWYRQIIAKTLITRHLCNTDLLTWFKNVYAFVFFLLRFYVASFPMFLTVSYNKIFFALQDILQEPNGCVIPKLFARLLITNFPDYVNFMRKVIKNRWDKDIDYTWSNCFTIKMIIVSCNFTALSLFILRSWWSCRKKCRKRWWISYWSHQTSCLI